MWKKIGTNLLGILLFAGFLAVVLYTGILGDAWQSENGSTAQENSAAKSTLSGVGTWEDPLQITDMADYELFAKKVAEGNTYKDKIVRLEIDLDFADVETPVMIGEGGDKTAVFAGTFDGNGKSIRNLNRTSESDALGLFLHLSGTVCNLKMEGGQILADDSGAIAAATEISALIVNCSSNVTVEGDKSGSFVGNSLGTLHNCVGLTANAMDLVGVFSLGEVKNSYVRTPAGMALSGSNGHNDWDTAEITEMGKVLSGLNMNLDIIGITYGIPVCFTWQGDEIVLSENNMIPLSDISAVCNLGGKKVKLSAYYSTDRTSWCFVLPAGFAEKTMPVIVQDAEGNAKEYEISALTQEEIDIEHGSYSYHVVCLQAVNVPTMYLQTSGENGVALLNESKENELSGNMTVTDRLGNIAYKGTVDKMNSRGNDSWAQPKKGISLTLTNRTNLLGLGENEDYVLLPGYRDSSLITYRVLADMEKQIGFTAAPETCYVHLYIDGAYRGIYFLTERIEIDSGRFELVNSYEATKEANEDEIYTYEMESWKNDETGANRHWYDIPNEPEDLTGGYIIEMDMDDSTDEQSRFVSDAGIIFTMRSNTCATYGQVTYMADLWQDFEDALFAEDGYNEKGGYYADYIDLTSFADQWLLFEMNAEPSITGSVYYYKDSDTAGDGKLHAVYEWDAEHSCVDTPDKSYIPRLCTKSAYGYWIALMKHEDFMQTVEKEWQEKFVPALEQLLQDETTENTEGVSPLNWYNDAFSADGLLDTSRWVWCNMSNRIEELRSFYTKRMKFLNAMLPYYDDGYDFIVRENNKYYGVTVTGKLPDASAEPGEAAGSELTRVELPGR
ncbi:MAG: CotH kinase family protein [Lachnospiraceae bacterium]|nr:CotH kinase family protein [Lachnospiraceae bacterium]